MTTIYEPTQEQIETLVAPYFEYLSAPYPIGFAVGYISAADPDRGRVFYYGSLLNQFRQKLPLGGDTYFPIASASKTFTAALYAYGVQEGLVPPGATLGDYYSRGPIFVRPELRDVPLSTLANYTSGLPADDLPPIADQPDPLPEPYTALDMFLYLYVRGLWVSAPGESYAYSNLGFALLAEAVTAAGGGATTFDRLLRRHILQPLGMRRTQMFLDTSPYLLPVGFSAQSGMPSAILPTGPQYPAYNGAGGLVSTPDDMLRWLKFNMNLTDTPLNKLLPATQLPSTNVVAAEVYDSRLGLGWFLSDVGDALDTVWKDGVVMGYNSYVAFLQSPAPGREPSQAGVFVLTNSDGPAVYTLANDLLLLMAGQQPFHNKLTYPKRKRGGRAL